MLNLAAIHEAIAARIPDAEALVYRDRRLTWSQLTDRTRRLGDVLRRHGLKVRLQEDGWFASRIVQIAWHALSYISNPADRHAALYLAVTELGSLDLEAGLSQLRLADPERIAEL